MYALYDRARRASEKVLDSKYRVQKTSLVLRKFGVLTTTRPVLFYHGVDGPQLLSGKESVVLGCWFDFLSSKRTMRGIGPTKALVISPHMLLGATYPFSL